MDVPDLAYLTRGDDAPQRLFVCGLLSVLGITWPLVLGYTVAVARGTFRGETAPPSIDRWAPLVRDGALASAILLAYALPLIAAAMLAGWPGGTVSSVTILGVSVLTLVSAYVLPGALARFAHRDTLAAGLDGWTILDVILLPAYARTWAGVALTASVLGVILWVLSSLGTPGIDAVVWIVGTLVGFVVAVFAARAFARTYGIVMRLETDASGMARRSSADGTD
jgi:hypothetical protein